MNVEQLIQSLNISNEHKLSVEEIQKYVEDNRIQELFNVMYSGV